MGSLSVTSDAGSSPDVVNLSGTGTPAPAPAVGFSINAIGFGCVVVNKESAGQTVTLTNTGDATLNIVSITADT
ncbi:hypothetical protein ABTN42_22690, partial [Acinetobacter baumannii]